VDKTFGIWTVPLARSLFDLHKETLVGGAGDGDQGDDYAQGILEALGHLRVRDLTTAVIQRYAQNRLDQSYRPGTVNNELGVLRAALNRKRRHGELSQVPYVPSLPTDNVRRGFVEPEQFQEIVAHLGGVYLDVAEFVYLAARRLGEVVSLPWAWVDRDAHEIRWPRTKSGEPLTLPLSPELAAILERRWQARPVGEWLSPWVFHSGRRRRGHVSHTSVERHWKRAVTAAGFPGLVPHDLRRSGVRNMIRAGVHAHVAMAISGHRSEAIFRRYNIVSGRDQLEALGRVAAYLEQRTKPGQWARTSLQASRQSPEISTVRGPRRRK
jgi:integrase